MDESTETFTNNFIKKNAEYSRESSSHHWIAWIWENIVLLAVSGTWPAQHYPYYFSDFWDIFCERKKSWEKVYFLFDTNKLPIQSEEFRGYVRENWAHLLDRKDFCLCIIESSSMKHAIWKSIYRLLNVESKIQLFRDHTAALQWIQENRSVFNTKAKNLKGGNSIPEELNLKWVKAHAHIRLIAKDLQWSLMAWRNIIILEIQKYWNPNDIKEYMYRISGLPSLLLEKWNKIFLIFDVSLMEFSIKDAPRFLQPSWLTFLDRDDMKVCIVHKKKLNRFLWRQLLWQIKKLNRAKVFSDCDAALTWIRSEIFPYVENSR